MSQKANKKDINGDDIFVGDLVKLADEVFEVKYGNYTYLGAERTGFYLQGSEAIVNAQLPLTNKAEKI